MVPPSLSHRKDGTFKGNDVWGKVQRLFLRHLSRLYVCMFGITVMIAFASPIVFVCWYGMFGFTVMIACLYVGMVCLDLLL